MKIYLVGGYCRDMILKNQPKDKDFVVCDATPQDLLDLNFQQVGCDFPVFLHPITNDEFALARRERKSGNGYYGFETDYNPTITLKEDLLRRDLCCNSIALEVHSNILTTGELKIVGDFIDPFNGIQDLENGLLRHVSDAFADDPVRVLRVARFVARYDFDVDEGTLKLMETLVTTGELNELTPERVWAELEKAVMENFPLKFFQVLDDVGAADVLFSELLKPIKPIMVGETLDRSVLLFGDFIDRLIIICAGSDTENIQVMLERLKAPRTVKQTLKMSSIFINKILCHDNDFETAEEFVELLDEIHAWKLPTTFHKVMCVLIIFDNDFIHNIAFSFLKVFRAGIVAEFDMLTTEQQATLQGKEISEAIAEVRLQLVKDIF